MIQMEFDFGLPGKPRRRGNAGGDGPFRAWSTHYLTGRRIYPVRAKALKFRPRRK